ncbi:unnamed protein product [Didymodactylos carnosus]|uniref:Uncharacterized protein n=1 Tax=Didymodactylos carnosus TaxID=1234261 RepID=A0A8S2G2W0_9BILA|nr:unnamed protein product [Didymodactylos carnosus]CAF4410809.1 unnamed protein product [Didymodactylos carnosus]
MRIPIITQNFTSAHQDGTPDLYSIQPLMLLPQSQQPMLDEQQNGFNNLFLHDLNRHRNTYIRSYNAYEAIKKRHDFVLRKENLKSLYRFEDRLERKQEQYIDQSLHAYEQCFVKVISNNPYSSIIGQRPRTAIPIQPQSQLPPAFDKFHAHYLTHSTPLMKIEQDSNPQQPHTALPQQQGSHRYQKNNWPKSKQTNGIYRTAQSFHDACLQQQQKQQQQQPFVQKSNEFLSFTESYLQKFGNSFLNEKQPPSTIVGQKPYENERRRPLSAAPSLGSAATVDIAKKEQQPPEPPTVTIKTTIQQRSKAPQSSPVHGYNDAVRDGALLRSK